MVEPKISSEDTSIDVIDSDDEDRTGFYETAVSLD
jgi:hypothetical protein